MTKPADSPKGSCALICFSLKVTLMLPSLDEDPEGDCKTGCQQKVKTLGGSQYSGDKFTFCL